MSAEQPCAPGEHLFSRSLDTNEPIGRCWACDVSVEWAEAQEDEPPLAYADLPEGDREAYDRAVDAESVALGR